MNDDSGSIPEKCCLRRKSHVLLLGAGATIAATYPPATKLLSAVDSYVSSGQGDMLKDDWEGWVKFRDSTENETLRSLLNTENPEIALSTPDLLDKGRDDHLNTVFTGKEGETIAAWERLQSPALWGVHPARLNLLKCLNEFFRWKSLKESNNGDEREYLRSYFKRTQLRPGDTVLTLNWDSTAERTLGEMGLWNPSDGYGISKNLKHNTVLLGAEDSQSQLSSSPKDGVITEKYKGSEQGNECPLQPSTVKVLKLHGSVG